MSTPRIDIRPDHWKIVRDILHKHVPQYEVWAFGSRAKWTAKDYSDLDLCVISDKPLSLSVSAALADDFSESDLPWKVDVVDWATTAESFHKIIERDKVVVQRGGLCVWHTYPIAELTINHDGKRKPVKESERRAGPYPYYGASGIVDYVDDYLIDGDYLLVAEDGENLRTRQTPIAFMARGKSWVNNHAHIVTGNDKADTRFLMYALQAADVSAYLTGAVMPKLTQGNLNRIPISCPELDEQRAIAHILGTLDDKIELNRRMNETLEAIARAMFKSWFVDFDPVRAKMSGEPPESICQRLGLTPDILALFPDCLVDSELGEIPDGWREKRVDDVLELAYGKALKATERIEGEVPVYGSGGVTGYHSESLVDGPGIIIGRKGTVGSLYWEDRSFFPIDTVFYVIPKVQLTFCYYLLQTLGLERMNTDAAVPGLNRNNVYRLTFASPPDELRKEFDWLVKSHREKIFSNFLESKTLVDLRDSLLPKLLSGELLVPLVGTAMEAIA